MPTMAEPSAATRRTDRLQQMAWNEIAHRRTDRLHEMAWNEIADPGCYLVLGSGNLIRVPQEAVPSGHSPLITVTSIGETRVAKLSEDPAEPVIFLRTIAEHYDYQVNF